MRVFHHWNLFRRCWQPVGGPLAIENPMPFLTSVSFCGSDCAAEASVATGSNALSESPIEEGEFGQAKT